MIRLTMTHLLSALAPAGGRRAHGQFARLVCGFLCGFLVLLTGFGTLGTRPARAQAPLDLPEEIPEFDNGLEPYGDYNIAFPIMDVANLAQEGLESVIIKDSNEKLFWEIVGLYLQLNYLRDPAFRDLSARQQLMEALARTAGAYGYGRDDLVVLLQGTFPGLTEGALGLFAEQAERYQRALQTAKNNIAVLKQHYLQIQEDLVLLQKYRDQVMGDVPWVHVVYPTAKAYGVMNEASLFALQEARLMEQLGAMNLNATALRGLHRVQERADRRRALLNALLGMPPSP